MQSHVVNPSMSSGLLVSTDLLGNRWAYGKLLLLSNKHTPGMKSNTEPQWAAEKPLTVPMLYVNIAQWRGGKARCFHLYPLVRQSLGCSQGILALQKQATCPRGEHAARNTWGWALWHGFFSAAQKQSGFYTQSSAFSSAPGFPQDTLL